MSHTVNDPSRREFLGTLGVAFSVAGAAALPRESIASPGAAAGWDMSWADRVAKAPYKAVFDSPTLSDGSALDLAAGIQDNFKDAYDTDENVRMVIVMRQLGQVMAFNDDLWDRYGIGEDRKIIDPVTKQPAQRNPFTKALDALHARGAIFLVCNRASMNFAASAAERTKRDVEQVRAEVRSGLVPGATLMPTGVFALVRAQNAGCAYMRGS
jgi:intracellular sulfur oxidation DsrE/DsrF family protein